MYPIVLALSILITVVAMAYSIPPSPASTKEEAEGLPGLYKVAGRGGDVGNVYCVLTPEPVLIDCAVL